MVDEELLSQNEEKVVENKEEKKTLLSIKDLVVKFRVRGRILTAIRVI